MANLCKVTVTLLMPKAQAIAARPTIKPIAREMNAEGVKCE